MSDHKVIAPWGPAAPLPPETPKAEKLEKLRAKFPPASIGKLPRATSKDARPGKCGVCGGWHKLPAIHLDYVGHAEVTDRLLSVDPEWDWSPLSFDEDGMPRFIRGSGGNAVGLWIKLTVCGVTRLGYGSVEGGAFDAEKQLIGDALRNAAMRFGVALDLWSKNELESNVEAPTESEQVVARAASDPVWDPPAARQEHAPGKSTPGSDAPPSAATKGRTIRGVPITVPESWALIRTLKIKGKSAYANMAWGELDAQADPSAFTAWLEDGVNSIIKYHNAAKEAGRPHVPLPAAQRALIAFEHLLERRAGTVDDDDGTVPLTEEEMRAADEKAGGAA